ncbi:hypothetical protein QE429_003901 [Bacillus sp. SORGH_AS 510]|uniref:hypothetical protein n=1 Tax=Bacillus sp. SORGH_AS_0510 TaxID=3041771 RepID=UPI00278AE9BC|nr:hypothetical protein [Bacillus sp. SORGH_AS_0510]MDQ1147074.1 hypothetical protein [Bacillus sp. SORGH_AS_0510]
MSKLPVIAMILFVFVAFFLHLLALMKIFPLLISTPILFLALLIIVHNINNRKRFRGF